MSNSIFEQLNIKHKEFLEKKPHISQISLNNFNSDFELRFTHDSTAIEGNTLTLLETKVILEQYICRW